MSGQTERTIRRFQWQNNVENRWGNFDDAICVDMKTGKIVCRYDLGDPADWNPDYGGQSRSEMLWSRGLDPNERIPESQRAKDDGGPIYGEHDGRYD